VIVQLAFYLVSGSTPKLHGPLILVSILLQYFMDAETSKHRSKWAVGHIDFSRFSLHVFAKQTTNCKCSLFVSAPISTYPVAKTQCNLHLLNSSSPFSQCNVPIQFRPIFAYFVYLVDSM